MDAVAAAFGGVILPRVIRALVSAEDVNAFRSQLEANVEER